jgi:hypothetical protein
VWQQRRGGDEHFAPEGVPHGTYGRPSNAAEATDHDLQHHQVVDDEHDLAGADHDEHHDDLDPDRLRLRWDPRRHRRVGRRRLRIQRGWHGRRLRSRQRRQAGRELLPGQRLRLAASDYCFLLGTKYAQ